MDTQFVLFQTAKVEPEESVIKLPPIPLPSAAAFVYSRSEPLTLNSNDAPFVFSRTTPTEETEQPATEESSSYKNTILVNKSNLTVTVYDKDGKSIFNAPVSTGKVSGLKQKVGDNRTPEGTFKISGYENYKGDKYKIQKFNSEEAIRLNTPGWTGILFHGDANEPQYLGKQGSSEGCIRMSKEQLSKMLDLIGRDSVKNYNVVISAKEGTKIPKFQTPGGPLKLNKDRINPSYLNRPNFDAKTNSRVTLLYDDPIKRKVYARDESTGKEDWYGIPTDFYLPSETKDNLLDQVTVTAPRKREVYHSNEEGERILDTDATEIANNLRQIVNDNRQHFSNGNIRENFRDLARQLGLKNYDLISDRMGTEVFNREMAALNSGYNLEDAEKFAFNNDDITDPNNFSNLGNKKYYSDLYTAPKEKGLGNVSPEFHAMTAGRAYATGALYNLFKLAPKALEFGLRAMNPSSYTGLLGSGTYTTPLGGTGASLAGAAADTGVIALGSGAAAQELADNGVNFENITNNILATGLPVMTAGVPFMAAYRMNSMPRWMYKTKNWLTAPWRISRMNEKATDRIFRRRRLNNDANNAEDELSSALKTDPYFGLFQRWINNMGQNPTRKNPLSSVDFSKMSKEDFLKFMERHDDDILFLRALTEAGGDIRNIGGISLPGLKTGRFLIKDFKTGLTREYFLPPIVTENKGYKFKEGKFSAEDNLPTSFVEEITINTPLGEKVYTVPADFAQQIKNNMSYVTNDIFSGHAKPFGSALSVGNGELYHNPHDYEVLMTLEDAQRHPEFKNWSPIRPDTYSYSHSIAGDIDVNVIREKDGQAVGQLAHELYMELYPEEYSRIAKEYFGKGLDFNENVPLPISARQLLNETDTSLKGISDAYSSSKPKHLDRTTWYNNYGNVDTVTTAFTRNMNRVMGGRYRPTNIPLELFSNVERNEELFDRLGLEKYRFIKEQTINNPKRMKLAFDTYVAQRQFLGRGIDKNYMGKKVDILKDLVYWYPDTTGGTRYGVGTNSVVGGNSGHGEIYASIIPERMKPLTGTTPEEVLSQIDLNFRNSPLTLEEYNIAKRIADKYKISTPNYQPNNTTLTNFLQKTKNQRGENYKNYLKEIAETFDVPAITNGEYGGTHSSRGTYASLTEDLTPNAIAQIFIGTQDRPHIFATANNFNVTKDLIDLAIRRALLTRNSSHTLLPVSAYFNIVNREGLRSSFARKKYPKLYEDYINKRKRAGSIFDDLFYSGETAEEKIQEAGEKIYRRYNLAKKVGTGLGVGLGSVGLAAIIGKTLNEFGRNRRNLNKKEINNKIAYENK